jgi:hypothetical protein
MIISDIFTYYGSQTLQIPHCVRRSLKCGSFFWALQALQALQYSKCLYIFINLWHNLIMCHTVGMFKSSESMFSLTQTPFLSALQDLNHQYIYITTIFTVFLNRLLFSLSFSSSQYLAQHKICFSTWILIEIILMLKIWNKLELNYEITLFWGKNWHII